MASEPRADGNSALRRQIADLDNKIAALITAIEHGGEMSALTQQPAVRSRERDGLQARLRSTPATRQPTTRELEAAVEELGGLSAILATADPVEKSRLYQSLDIKLSYNHEERLVTATAYAACVQQRVRRGT